MLSPPEAHEVVPAVVATVRMRAEEQKNASVERHIIVAG
jgi:hypothetical protein